MTLKSLIKKSFIFGMSVTLLAPSLSQAFGEASTIQAYVGRQALVPLIKPSWGRFILHTDSLNKLYSSRSYQAIWVGSDGRPNAMAESLKSILAAADRHGLNPGDYWDADVEALYNAANTNQNNWITFELAASEAMIRFASHLSTGRFDPEQVDTDIKFKKKEFNEYYELANAVIAGPQGLMAGLDRLAPAHSRYTDLLGALAQLKNQKASGGWVTISSPGVVLKRGVTNPVIQQIRNRLNQLGYSVSNAGGNTFDAEFETVVKLYQEKNGLKPDGVIGTRSEVLRSLNYTVNQRIAQVEATMEKLRWLPKNIEQRHIFVNLATTEFRLQDESGQVFYFNTVNGQPFRRTPSMRDQITFVNLNPTWTVPHSIAIKDKLPKLREDSRYLEKHDMYLYDANTDERVDPSMIDWRSMTPKMFSYYIRQNPGPENALGVVKFPLQNPWAIYMHDTNERNLFAENERHRSSGCVRLERPLELAAYLLQDQPEWSLQSIKDFVPMNKGEKPRELERKVYLTKPMPVYFMYLTVEKSENGALRFVDDVYGQDLRLSRALANKKDAEADPSAKTVTSSSGYLQVNGTPGKFQIFQKVRAVRCDMTRRGSCDAPLTLDLNKAQAIPAGDYLVGFENSMYPGVVNVQAGQNTVLNLEKLAVPSSVRGQKIRIYRDFSQSAEQQKMLLEMFTMGRHFNRLEKENFGDLYLTGSWERDFVQRFTYEICPKLDAYGEVSSEAKEVCSAWNNARSPSDLNPLYQFGNDGTLQELWVTYPGDVISSKHPRYLVSAPMTGDDFVAVFPGVYKVQAEGSKGSTAVSLRVGNVQ
ncbi:L,D-transpeptidase family protein [Bdellovibrio svalbardensis]|uniref:L,D-transpeptidase family protein n=1 Tax=Bdellovibrio svalbardensis TaxID=2972972 RepID=A0ABT6DLU4_9BACT|nr:L,D-transpeptidase family protein [Bdellovibrio svalbardensis]MDG0817853.1 L,D-transpeptidase family protein [Bdellovibrio svalbardensis]